MKFTEALEMAFKNPGMEFVTKKDELQLKMKNTGGWVAFYHNDFPVTFDGICKKDFEANWEVVGKKWREVSWEEAVMAFTNGENVKRVIGSTHKDLKPLIKSNPITSFANKCFDCKWYIGE